MYRKLLGAAVLGCAALASTGAMADVPGDDWITIEEAIVVAKNNGYVVIYGIEVDDDNWEGEGHKADGKKREFRINGKSGTVVLDRED